MTVQRSGEKKGKKSEAGEIFSHLENFISTLNIFISLLHPPDMTCAGGVKVKSQVDTTKKIYQNIYIL